MSVVIPFFSMSISAVPRGRLVSGGPGISAGGAFRLPTDALGTFTLSMKNLVIGSRVRVETVNGGVELDSFVATAADHDRLLDRYASGSPFNDLRIKVRKASESPTYRPFESQAVAQLGVVTVYVFQESDE